MSSSVKQASNKQNSSYKTTENIEFRFCNQIGFSPAAPPAFPVAVPAALELPPRDCGRSGAVQSVGVTHCLDFITLCLPYSLVS